MPVVVVVVVYTASNGRLERLFKITAIRNVCAWRKNGEKKFV